MRWDVAGQVVVYAILAGALIVAIYRKKSRPTARDC